MMNIFRRVIFAFIYTVVYAFLSVDLVGAGHGTIFFLIPLLTWPFPLIALFLVSTTVKRRARLYFVALMSAHSLATILLAGGYLLSGDNGRLTLTFTVNPYYCLFTILWYLVGQLLIWGELVRELSQKRSKLL